jgi:hypothetical protein
MLPPPGTQARRELEGQAMRIGLDLLHQEQDLLKALYLTYTEHRMRFIEKRGLMDAVPGVGPAWAQALADARTLQEHVSQNWIKAITDAFESAPIRGPTRHP